VQEIKQTYYNACLKVTYNLCCSRFFPRETSMGKEKAIRLQSHIQFVQTSGQHTHVNLYQNLMLIERDKLNKFDLFRKIDFIKPKTGNESEQ